MSRVIRRIRLLVVGAAAVALSTLTAACGASSGNVYVGVGVVGPYWGYPGYYPPPTMIGRPPVYWEEEDEEDEEEDDAEDEEEDAVDDRAS